MPTVVVFVEGGVVQGVETNDEELEVIIVDRDDDMGSQTDPVYGEVAAIYKETPLVNVQNVSAYIDYLEEVEGKNA